jgi:hypothetical protein
VYNIERVKQVQGVEERGNDLKGKDRDTQGIIQIGFRALGCWLSLQDSETIYCQSFK